MTGAEQDAIDAAKWRALRNSARISAIGSAGLGSIPRPHNYAHLTLNFWTVHEAPSDFLALEWLEKYVEIAQRAQGIVPELDKKEAQRCPHDGGRCHHQCRDTCIRVSAGASLSVPYDGFPVKCTHPIKGEMPAK